VYANSIEAAVDTWALGGTRALEEAQPVAGLDPMPVAWRQHAARLEKGLRTELGNIPWPELSANEVRWLAQRLDPNSAPDDAQRVVRELLLMGRDSLDERELRELRLLLGSKPTVQALLKRPLVDLRASGRSAERWDARVLVEDNVIVGLREAIGFVADQIEIQEDSGPVDLTAKDGTTDYIAVREALVNQMLHQDYSDPTAPAQVELQQNRAVLFNPGYSLVAPRRLPEGARHQARNPLIARALRLVGFAELAGSGLTALQRAWRLARRRPPRIESSESSNSFSIELSWDMVEPEQDPNWKSRLGAAVTSEMAQVLELLLGVGALSTQELASGTGLSVDAVERCLERLAVQVLVVESEDRWKPTASAVAAWSKPSE
jgi:predicted HTH transcriptional regulator